MRYRGKLFLQSKGTEVVNLLQYLCSNDVDVPVGSIIHTGMQNSRGGYENDCSLARITYNQWVYSSSRWFNRVYNFGIHYFSRLQRRFLPSNDRKHFFSPTFFKVIWWLLPPFNKHVASTGLIGICRPMGPSYYRTSRQLIQLFA